MLRIIPGAGVADDREAAVVREIETLKRRIIRCERAGGDSRRAIYLPNTFFNNSLPRAAGSVRIFFSSSPSIMKSPSTAFVVT